MLLLLACSLAHSPTGIYPLPDFCDGLCGHDRGGKARPDLAQSKEEAPQKRQDHSLTQAPSPSAPTVAKIDFFSDEPLKRKRGGKARPDLAPAVDGAGGAGGGNGDGGGGGRGGAGEGLGVVGGAGVETMETVMTVQSVACTDFNTPLPRKRGGKARAVQSEQ